MNAAMIELGNILREFKELYRGYYSMPGYFAEKLGRWFINYDDADIGVQILKNKNTIKDSELYELARKIYKEKVQYADKQSESKSHT